MQNMSQKYCNRFYFSLLTASYLFTSFVYKMADSCRPVSRHGRYNATGPSSVQYTGDVSSYGNVDFTPSEGYLLLPTK